MRLLLYPILFLVILAVSQTATATNDIGYRELERFSLYMYDQNVYGAMLVVIDELDKRGIYNRKDMVNVINNKKLRIVITSGVREKNGNRKCLYTKNIYFKDKCLSGYFNGDNIIVILKRDKLHNSSLAHEMFHFFQHELGGGKQREHFPKELWQELFGFDVSNSIGSINIALKKVGL